MTVSPVPPAGSSSSKEAQAPRKQRRVRRPHAGGAADDCFACVKRKTKCDRRRPYCSQCLEVGNECSGYKTQLTWGVGVASRGKLRGLSLPIAKAPPVAPASKKSSPHGSPRPRTGSRTASQWSDHDDRDQQREDIGLRGNQAVSLPTTPYGAYPEYMRFNQAERVASTAHTNWAGLPSYSGALSIPPRMHKLNTSLGHFPAMGDAMSSSTIDSLSEMDYPLSPMSHSYPQEDISYVSSPAMMYDTIPSHNSPVPQSPASAILIEHRAAPPTSCPGLVYAPSEPSSSISTNPEGFEQTMGAPRLLVESEALRATEGDAYNISPLSTRAPSWGLPASQDDETRAHVMERLRANASFSQYDGQSLQVSTDLINKMPFFMDYYENIMCPSMVLVDGPHNPFRRHILQLASSSRSLQHAICALAACNLRTKRRLSLGQDARLSPERLFSEHSEGNLVDSEEVQHRNLAAALLNQQLNDPAKSCHDSVLATILLLCHYRMVESGVAKFHTQFAGVKKILAMRNSAPFQSSTDSSWMEAIFTYFDAISASINDRETQMNQSLYGITMDASILPPGAENLIGCDSELFKPIARLGRLNLLSQQRPVHGGLASPTGRNGTPRAASPLTSPVGQAFKPTQQFGDFLNIGAPTHVLDGNGYASQYDDESLKSGLCSSPAYDDSRSTFWREWKEVRLALQSWEFDAQRLLASLPDSPTPAQVRDLGSLSEAFRYAALLYTERLASPNVPSSHNNFRNLVSQVLYYSASLESGSSAEKFLLWPLFVAGSECVNELQQNIVRNKCRAIMNRSGYMNNKTAIEVLERLWAGEYDQDAEGQLRIRSRGPFNWARCIGGPGVDVEWIMF